MKRLTQQAFLVLLLAFVVLPMWAADETITFSQLYSADETVNVVSANNFTLTFAKGSGSTAPKYYSNGSAVRMYNANTMTIVAAANTTITGITFTFSGSSYSLSGTFDVGTKSSDNSAWSGNATTIVYTCGSSQTRIQSMTVTYTVSGSPQPAAPTFDPASGTASTTDITVTMSTTTSGATIRYTIDGAAPTASTGTVGTTATITGVGEHTLRAVAVKNGVASTVASATYTITNPSSGGENRYVLVTDASTLQAGDKLIIASSAAAGSAYAIANTQKSGNRPATAVTIGSDNGTLSIDPTSATEIFELGGSAGAWTFKAVSEETSYNNQYLIASGNEKNNYLKYTSAATSNEAQANIAISNHVIAHTLQLHG